MNDEQGMRKKIKKLSDRELQEYIAWEVYLIGKATGKVLGDVLKREEEEKGETE